MITINSIPQIFNQIQISQLKQYDMKSIKNSESRKISKEHDEHVWKYNIRDGLRFTWKRNSQTKNEWSD